uniref:Uncharacterized protein n=2 Tax=Arion vulgaris TaxID=1028688 RepID=A0A0B7BNP5_9EUPU
MSTKGNKTVEVVMFHDHRKQKMSTGSHPEQTHHDMRKKTDGLGTSKRVFFDHRQFKYDVRKLGIHGLNKKDKETAMVDFLVELGAKRPKNKCYHINEYQQIVQQRKEEEKKLETLERNAGIKAKKSKAKQKKRQDDILNHVDGQVGIYRDGVQFIKRLKQ